jgi:hypothetical protein
MIRRIVGPTRITIKRSIRVELRMSSIDDDPSPPGNQPTSSAKPVLDYATPEPPKAENTPSTLVGLLMMAAIASLAVPGLGLATLALSIWTLRAKGHLNFGEQEVIYIAIGLSSIGTLPWAILAVLAFMQ